MKSKTQIDMVLEHMQKHGSINPKEAERLYGIMRLASRITDLRHLGYAIKSKTVKSVNRYGKPISFSEYSLEE